MKASGVIGNRKSTCLYLDSKILETAKQAGLNIGKASQNALIKAIEQVCGLEQENSLRSRTDYEGQGRDLGTNLLVNFVLNA